MHYTRFGGDPDKDVQFIADTLYASHSGRIASSAPVFAEHLGISTEEWLADYQNLDNDKQLLTYIQKLREYYKTGLLSNIGQGGFSRYFTDKELAVYFDVVIASGQIGYAKPEAEAFEITAERLGMRLDECVFTDDKEEYCEAARGVGMQAIVYKSFAQFKSELEKLLNTSDR